MSAAKCDFCGGPDPTLLEACQAALDWIGAQEVPTRPTRVMDPDTNEWRDVVQLDHDDPMSAVRILAKLEAAIASAKP